MKLGDDLRNWIGCLQVAILRCKVSEHRAHLWCDILGSGVQEGLEGGKLREADKSQAIDNSLGLFRMLDHRQ